MAKNNNRAVQSDDELRRAAKHVCYETQMLVHAGSYLEFGHRHRRRSRLETKMALECFLLHYRNIRDFLCPVTETGDGKDAKPPKATDILASDFLGLTVAANVANATRLGIDRIRINEMLSHLTFRRDAHIQTGNVFWPVRAMESCVREEFEAFRKRLPTGEVGRWFDKAFDTYPPAIEPDYVVGTGDGTATVSG